MSIRSIISLLIVLACFVVSNSFAQQTQNRNITDQYRVIQWTIEDSLPSGAGNTMHKDANGFLWIGSIASDAPLSRFDGTRFKTYYPDKDRRGALNSGGIQGFKEDSLHNIWMGTDKGISRYDSKADTFTNFFPLDNSWTSQRYIDPFWATKDEIFCLEPGSLITAFNIHTLSRKILVQPSNKNALPDPTWNSNKSFFEKSTNSIWTLCWDAEGYGQLQQIFLDGRMPQYYRWPCYHNPRRKHTRTDQPRHNAEDMKYDPKRNSVWINSGEGLIRFSLADNQFYRIDASDKLTGLKNYDRGVGIDIDKDGRIWLGTFINGVFVYDTGTDELQPLFTDSYQQQVVGADNLHIYCDTDGIVWVSNWMDHGIYELLPFNSLLKKYTPNSKENSLSSGMITTIIPGPQGKLWLGTADGLNIFDPSTEKFEVLRAKDLPGIKGTAIIPFYIDTLRQKAWIRAGSQETYEKYFGMQMYEMDIRTRQCQPIIFRHGTKTIDRSSIPHTLVRPYNDGIIFCNEGYGVFEIKAGSLVADLIIPLTPPAGFGSIALMEDRYLFLKSGGNPPNYTFENINGKWTKKSHFLDTLFWSNVLYEKKEKTYWVSFRDSLIHYDQDFRKIKSYGKRNGYTSMAINMKFDNDGNLWFVTVSKNICRLDTSTGVITILSDKDGYQEQDYNWYAPMATDDRSNIYFGVGWQTGTGKKDWGLDRIYPERYFGSTNAIVYFASIFINRKPFSLPVEVNSLKELQLDHKQNTIRIETGVIDFYSKKTKGQIRYKLERNGKTSEWEFPLDRIIRYEDLAPGTYRLIIQASNASGEFISPEKILLIHISPPFWQTWWFRVLALIIVIDSVYGFVRYRSHNLKKRNVLLEKKVTERTNELNRSLSELKATQEQLIHSEKMASLGELTSGIAHEIKNPLNFINNFSEINMELITEVAEEQIPKLNGSSSDELASIIKTLRKNSEKINHHGKRVDEIVKSMLQHSRLGNATKESVNINTLCEESLKLAYHGFKAKEKTFNASFETHFAPDLPRIMVVPQDLGRVMLNLINNAFYTVNERKRKNQVDSPETESFYKPIVTISTKKCDKKILISVTDNGMGIPEKIITKIFQPFFTTKPTGEGTGLGLSMSYDIITKSHGGEVHVKSKEGEGTNFEILLPIQ